VPTTGIPWRNRATTEVDELRSGFEPVELMNLADWRPTNRRSRGDRAGRAGVPLTSRQHRVPHCFDRVGVGGTLIRVRPGWRAVPGPGRAASRTPTASRVVHAPVTAPRVRGWLGWRNYRIPWLRWRPSPTGGTPVLDETVTVGCHAAGGGPVSPRAGIVGQVRGDQRDGGPRTARWGDRAGQLRDALQNLPPADPPQRLAGPPPRRVARVHPAGLDRPGPTSPTKTPTGPHPRLTTARSAAAVAALRCPRTDSLQAVGRRRSSTRVP
jgi:hypothetical protein